MLKDRIQNNKEIILIYVIALAMLPLVFNFHIVIGSDTNSYIQAWDRISHGEIDILRTPVYPVYLGILKGLFGTQYFMMATVTGQLVVFLASILPFLRVARKMISSKEVALGITLFYAIYPGIINWCCWILTESFAISGMVFLAYYTIRLYEAYRLRYAIYSGLLIILLLMLRPIFVYLLPIYFILWAIVFIKQQRRRQAVSGMIGIAISTGVLCVYLQLFANTYGMYAISSVSTINRWMYACQESLLNPEAVSDPALRAYISKIDKTQYNFLHDSVVGSLWKVDSNKKGHYSLKSVKEALNESDMSHPLLILEATGKKFSQLSLWKLFPLYTSSEIFSFAGMHIICIFLLIYGIFVWFQFVHLNNDLWISMLFYILGVSSLIVAVLGANADYARLIQPSIPIYLILFGQMCTIFIRKPVRELEFA